MPLQRGVKFRDGMHLEEAFNQFDAARALMPQNPQFLTARELVRAQLVFNHVERGNFCCWRMHTGRPPENFVPPSIWIRTTSSLANGWKKPTANLRHTAQRVTCPAGDSGEIHLNPRTTWPPSISRRFTRPVC